MEIAPAVRQPNVMRKTTDINERNKGNYKLKNLIV